MYVHIDPSELPPVVRVCEPDDFKGFKVVLSVPEHVWIAPEVLTALAGRDDDVEWKQNLAAMLEFAASRGWLDEAGRIRAHVEAQPDVRKEP